MSRQLLSNLLFGLMLLLVILAAATVLPHEARVISDLGYKTWCPFAPYSTGTLLLLAGLAWIVRKYVDAQPAA